MPRKPKLDRHELSKGQLEIMEIVWASGEVTAVDVHRRINELRPVSPTTIRTILRRLADKGWLKYRTLHRTFYYRAAVSRETGIGERVVGFLDDFCGGKPVQLMSALLDSRGLTDEELNRIQALIEKAKSESRDDAEEE